MIVNELIAEFQAIPEEHQKAVEMPFESVHEPIQNRARTKIIATVGPACRAPEVLGRLIRTGVDVFRLNMAHGSPEEHDATIDDIRQLSRTANRPIGILVDLAGPKIRLGQLMQEPIHCHEGEVFRFVRDGQEDGPFALTSNYEPLVDELQIDDRVLLADGTVSMVVTQKAKDGVHCCVTGPGVIRSRQGINLPGAKLSVPALNDRDIENAVWAAKRGVDFIGLSFVRTPTEIRQLKEIIGQQHSRALVIAKIEKPEALEQLDAIVESSDGIMVARGDLGVEIDVAEMPVAQKKIINTCTRFRRPVIVATQMLDSMQRSSRPTRAEVTDVANAILDGADACMLSGETAIGDFPCESVEMMNRIMVSTERSMKADWQPRAYLGDYDGVHPITSSVVYASGRIAAHLGAQMVVVATRSGKTAIAKAKQRDFIPTIAVSDNEETLRQLTLFWGIDPLTASFGYADQQLVKFVEEWGRQNGILAAGDKVIVVGVTGTDQTMHNSLLVHEVSDTPYSSDGNS